MSDQQFLKKILIHLFFLLTLISVDSVSQTVDSERIFKTLSLEEGLSQSNVTAIFKDSRGFMWFGTYDGLNKYDGYQFTVYKNNPEDSTSIRASLINDIIEDSQGYLWIATSEGLERYNHATNSFSHVYNNKSRLKYNSIETVMEDNNGNLWAGTYSEGLFLVTNTSDFPNIVVKNFNLVLGDMQGFIGQPIYDIFQDSHDNVWIGTEGSNAYVFVNNKLKTIELSDQNGSNSSVWSISEDHNGNIWVGGDNGLTRINKNLSDIKNYFYSANNPTGISRGNIKIVYHDNFNNMWVGTQTGLNMYIEKSDEFVKYRHDEFDKTTLSSSEAWSMYQDEQDILWIGTFSGGLSLSHPSYYTFGTHKHNPLRKNSVGGSSVMAFYEDEKSNIWIGLDHNGMDYYDIKNKTFKHFKTIDTNLGEISDFSIMTIKADSYGYIWIGSYDHGLIRYDPENDTFKRYCANAGHKTISSNVIFTILEDSDKNLWVGTMKGGLELYNREQDSFTAYKANLRDSMALSNDHLWTMMELNKNEILIGTGQGLNIFHKDSQTFSRFMHNPKDSTSLSNNNIKTTFLDSKKRLWIGTRGGGLCLFDRKTQSFKSYIERDGLSNNNVLGILEDDAGNLWLSTYYGITKFNPETEEFRRYNSGLQGSSFNFESCLKLKDGRMLFGGTKGFNLFHPNSIKNNEQIPPVVITDFQIFNKSVQIKSNKNLQLKSTDEIKPIELSHLQSVFSFEFSALNFLNSEQNQYAYMLEDFENEWVYTSSNRRFATYTNLPAGTYTFKVKASNNDELWNEAGTSVSLIIQPPWWATLWFKVLLIAFLFSAVYTIYRIRIKLLNAQNRSLEDEVKNRTEKIVLQSKSMEEQSQLLKNFNEDILSKNKLLEDLHRQKDGMISVVAHDLRAPLNNIKGFIGLLPLDGSLNEAQTDYVDHMTKLVEQGDMLISDLLYVNGIRQFDIKLNSQTIELAPFLEDWLRNYKQEADRKKQTLNLTIDNDVVTIHTDLDIFRRILDNILTNAMKFSDYGKQIFLRLSQTENHVQIAIRDEGPGISEDEQGKLFTMFQKLSSQPTGGENSTGLGLAIVKALVEKLGGEVHVDSQIGKGTEFKVQIPLQ